MHSAMLLDSLWVLLTRLVMRAANFAVFILLARSLSVGEFGFYGYVMSTALVLSVAFDVGLRQSGAWVIGQEPAADPAVATHLVALWLVLAALGVLACWLLLVTGGYVAGYGGLALIAALNVAPMLCLRIGQGVFLGRGDIARLNRSELISRAVTLGGTVGLWALGRLELPAAISVLLGAHLAAAAYLLWQIRSALRPGLLFQAALVRRMLRYGAEPTAFRLVMLGALANSFTTMLYPCLSAQGLARWGIGAFALGSAVAAVAFWLLTPLSGLAGAGLAYALAHAATVAVIVIAYRRRFGFPVAAILLPQPEDARALGEIARSVMGRLRRG